MSQLQSEVRPHVLQMPQSGFAMQTGGSARKRTIKPTQTQTLTSTYPVQAQYNVTGVPGHSHNGSAVLSVLCDLKRSRGSELVSQAGVWSQNALTLYADNPGDSPEIENEDERFQRALERGIGEIFLRPENCHQEIHEPVRSIAEVRTLVAPDDRLQTLTYVEEVGGFVVPKGDATAAQRSTAVPYISDFPDVFVNILGTRDPLYNTITSGDDIQDGDELVGLCRLQPPTGQTGFNLLPKLVISRPADGSVGTLNDGSTWDGIVRFRWNPDKLRYTSDAFQVTLNRYYRLTQYTDAAVPQASVANEVVAGLLIEVPALETTRAYNGNCFLANDKFTNDQLFCAAAHKSMPKEIAVKVLAGIDLTEFVLKGANAVRISVGGSYAIYSSSEYVADSTYLARLSTPLDASLVCTALQAAHSITAADVAVGGLYNNHTSKFGSYGAKIRSAIYKDGTTPTQRAFPVIDGPANLEPGSPFYGLQLASALDMKTGLTRILYDNTLAQGDMPLVNIAELRTRMGVGYGAVGNDQIWQLTLEGQAVGLLDGTGGKIAMSDALMERTQAGNSDIVPPFYTDFDPQNMDLPNGNPNPVSAVRWMTFVAGLGTAYDHDAALLAVTNAVGEAATAIAQSRVVPDSEEWLIQPYGFDKFEPRIGGTGFDYDPLNIAENYEHKAASVPCRASGYVDNAEFEFNWDVATATLQRTANPTVAHKFYVLGDVEYSRNGGEHFARVHANVTDLTTATESKYTNAAAQLPLTIMSFGMEEDRRAVDQANRQDFQQGLTIGNVFEIQIADLAGTLSNASTHPKLIEVAADGTWTFQDLALCFPTHRRIFVVFNDNTTGGAAARNTVYHFASEDADVGWHVANDGTMRVMTKVRVYTAANANANTARVTTVIGNCAGRHKDTLALVQMGSEFQNSVFESSRFAEILAESDTVGPVYQIQKRISQHLCAPILNPNARIGCTSPLNYETMHLPPELRDFKLELRNVDFSFLPGPAQLENLVLYEFNGGNQMVAAEESLLHLPQFREKKSTAIQSDGSFDLEMFSPYGMPSHIAIFARDTDMSHDYLTQPLIKQLSIMCNTTMKKSNTILNANVHQLYHITQRNVNNRARYNRHTFNKRQVILMSAEDIGLMGLNHEEYQREKRAVFRFYGTVDQIGRVHVMLIYNNRGLHVYGKQLRVVRL